MLKLLFTVTIVSFLSNWSLAQSISTFTWDEKCLLEAKKNVMAGNTEYFQVINQLKQSADVFLHKPNVNVTEKSGDWGKYFPKGTDISLHEFVSFSTYYYQDTSFGKTWQDPWIRLESQGINSSVRLQFDYNRLVDMEMKVITTAKAFWFTNNRKYAQASVSQLREWFINPETRMFPQMNHAQFVPFHPKYKLGSAYGIIDAMDLHNVFNSIGLLKTSGEWTNADDAAMKKWAFQFANWLVNSPLGKKEGQKENNNNHGIYYDVLLITLWQYLDNYDGVDWKSRAKDYLINVVTDARIMYQIGNGQIVNGKLIYGGMFKELTRPSAVAYEIMCLNGFNYLEILGKKLNIDLYNWSYYNDKRTIKNAIEWVLPFLDGSEEWNFGNTNKNKIYASNVLPIFSTSANYIPSHFEILYNTILPSLNPLDIYKANLNLEFPRKLIFYNDFICKQSFLKNIAIFNDSNWQIKTKTLQPKDSSTGLEAKAISHQPSIIFFNAAKVRGNYSITTRFKILENSRNFLVGIVFKSVYDTLSANMYSILLSNSKGQSGIYKVMDSTTVTKIDIKNSIEDTIVCNKIYDLRITSVDKEIIVKLNNKIIGRINNAIFLEGNIGLISQSARCTFLDIRVTNASTNMLPFIVHNSFLKSDIQAKIDSVYHIEADAIDYDGSIERVEFFCNSKKIGQITKPPYTCNLNAVAKGKSIITIKAIDNEGASSKVQFSINSKNN